MNNDLILISIGDPVIEPPDMFAGRPSAKGAADAPRIERLDSGADVWRLRHTMIPEGARNAVAPSSREYCMRSCS
ncbi:hypothetical protein I6A60_25190 [Frankia sp. AgB1.9]|uniref:hypothetical protein n=1 Tax=unclassified Frankia TaxID=2632575 RepID=UPI0019314197|nr:MULTISPECIES: hypothetical protein [unclassified Frankia]MBL7488470.1 hypothetical protein [Frankia sp. AgW1.1]MBL7551135.1 hypothetical protein [Frankia sp. AgB1.9]MBL7620843.1 hypothetical protein [Frankia sp. AgB1.8]